MLRKQLTNICSTTTALPCYCYYHTENYLVYQFTYNKKAKKKILLSLIVGATGFEPATTWSTGLRYTPFIFFLAHLVHSINCISDLRLQR